MSELKKTKIFEINEFIQWDKRGELKLSPKYQRNQVWNLKAKSYLIDTLIRGLPIPPVFIRQITDIELGRITREVIDGQQRLRTILEFISGEFCIQKNHNKEFANYYYKDLPDEIKTEFLSYDLAVEIVKTNDDSLIYDMFARLNTNSITLNKQELRNAKFWGDFKVTVYNLAYKYRHFFETLKTFSDIRFSRMDDVEFISQLLIYNLNGIVQGNPSDIDNYYAKYDENFDPDGTTINLFRKRMKQIEIIFNSEYCEPRIFTKKNYFYTLYATLSKLDEDNNFNFEKSKDKISTSLTEFEVYINKASEGTLDSSLTSKYLRFVEIHNSRTTNINERTERINILTEFIKGRLND